MADTKYTPRLRSLYDQSIREKLTAQFGYSNGMQVPALDSRSMGQLMMQLMIAATVGGKLYEVNPYDQPAVEEGKVATWARAVAEANGIAETLPLPLLG